MDKATSAVSRLSLIFETTVASNPVCVKSQRAWGQCMRGPLEVSTSFE